MEDYYSKYRHYFDDALEEPITAKPAPEREGVPKGVDPGGPLTTKIVGITTNPTQDQIPAFQEKLKEGASKVELGFMGTQKGSSQAPTPESMSVQQRKDIRDLARLNKVETTVHAAPSVSNLSGFTQQGFNEQARSEALNEIRRAVDFAADASTGGAVVVHWDEWQRPIGSSYGLQEDKGAEFHGYDGEHKKDGSKENGYGPAQAMFVDTETDQIQAIRRDMKFTEPVVEKIGIEESQDRKTGATHKYLKYDYERDQNGEPIAKEIGYDDVIKMEKRLNDPNDPKYGAFAKFFSEENHKGLKELRDTWQEIEDMPENDDIQKKKKEDRIFLFHFLRKKAEDAFQQYQSSDSMWRYHQDVMREDPRTIEQDKQKRDMAWVQFNDQISKLKNFKPLEEYSEKKAAETVSEAALYAWQRSKNNEGLHRNLYIAPESVFPQQFGSHPDEMMTMIEDARESMKNKLMKTNQVKDEKEAQKAAEESIRATLDIGHLNMWRRHMKMNEGETPEEFDKRFKKWAVDKSKEMAEKGYVGHAHVSDNFGFGDEHLTVGEGNTPIKEFVEELRRTGKVDDVIVEVGSYNAKTAMPDAWKNLGVSMGKGNYFNRNNVAGPSSYFSGVRGAYAGKTRKPSYVFGGYSPQIKNERWQGWSPWTGIPL